MKNTTKRKTFAGDLRAALSTPTTKEFLYDDGKLPHYYNDKHLTCRRLKFGFKPVTDEQLETIQAVIQERRPEYSITVSRWPGRWENIVVYYRPKVGRYLSAVEKVS